MNFKAELPSSKSIVNRYLILKEGYPELSLKWKSEALDIVHLEHALNTYKETKEIYIGEGGTTLRFLALFLSSQKGSWFLKGTKNLFKRPHKELVEAIEALGAKAVIQENSTLNIESDGWKNFEIEVDALKTTQVLTGLILTALASKNKLTVKLKEVGAHSGYLSLTQKFIASLGFELSFENNEIHIPMEQTLKDKLDFRHLESDWSSAAFVYVMASVLGKAKVQGLMENSIQPDSKILEVLKSSGVLVKGFTVEKPVQNKINYLPLNLNIQDCPDLFPVLAVFSCFCRGESILYGAPQLIFKESNRIELVYRLLTQCGYKISRMEDGLKIKGLGLNVLEHEEFNFDVSSDHRIFMACEILKKFGYKININGMESVKKSFPEYLDKYLNLDVN